MDGGNRLEDRDGDHRSARKARKAEREKRARGSALVEEARKLAKGHGARDRRIKMVVETERQRGGGERKRMAERRKEMKTSAQTGPRRDRCLDGTRGQRETRRDKVEIALLEEDTQLRRVKRKTFRSNSSFRSHLSQVQTLQVVYQARDSRWFIKIPYPNVVKKNSIFLFFLPLFPLFFSV